MRVAVIDIGSNSVRLAVFEGDIAILKTLITSRLAEGFSGGLLTQNSIERTVRAVCELKQKALEYGVGTIYAFATEAVRRAENRADFLRKVKSEAGINIYVASGEEEANLAVVGALNGDDGCVVDLGGASTEVAVSIGSQLVYSYSLPIGAVVLNNMCGTDESKLTPFIAQKVMNYGDIPLTENVVAVGGTATSIAACALGLKEYSSSAVNGCRLTLAVLEELIGIFKNKSAEEICKDFCVDTRRAEIIYGGAMLLYAVMQKISVQYFFVSENDNLDGFYSLVSKGAIKPDDYNA